MEEKREIIYSDLSSASRKQPYDAMVYIEGDQVIAIDSDGKIIAKGVAGTDDSRVIQAAVDFTPPDGALRVFGNFDISNQIVISEKSGMSLDLTGATFTKVGGGSSNKSMYGAEYNNNIIVITSSRRVSIINGTLDSNLIGGSNGILLYGDGFSENQESVVGTTIYGCEIKNSRSHPDGEHANGAGIHAANSFNTTIDGCKIYHNQVGVILTGPTTPVITHGNLITNCWIYENYKDDTCAPYYGEGIYGYRDSGTVVSSNEIFSNENVGVWFGENAAPNDFGTIIKNNAVHHNGSGGVSVANINVSVVIGNNIHTNYGPGLIIGWLTTVVGNIIYNNGQGETSDEQKSGILRSGTAGYSFDQKTGSIINSNVFLDTQTNKTQLHAFYHSPSSATGNNTDDIIINNTCKYGDIVATTYNPDAATTQRFIRNNIGQPNVKIVTESEYIQQDRYTTYIVDSPTTVVLTLPHSPVLGWKVQIIGVSEGGWNIVRNPGRTYQYMHLGKHSGSSIKSTTGYESCTLECSSTPNRISVTDVTGRVLLSDVPADENKSRIYTSSVLNTLGNTLLLCNCQAAGTSALTDHSRYKNVLYTNENHAPWMRYTGISNYCALNGTSRYIFRSNDQDFDFGDGTSDDAFTVTICINATTITSKFIIGKWDDNGAREWRLFLDTSGYLTAQLYDETADKYIGKKCSTLFPEGGWKIITMTYDGSKTSSGIKIYVDGDLNSTTAFEDAGYVAMSPVTAPLQVGALKSGSTYSEHFDGGVTWICIAAGAATDDAVWNVAQLLKGLIGL